MRKLLILAVVLIGMISTAQAQVTEVQPRSQVAFRNVKSTSIAEFTKLYHMNIASKKLKYRDGYDWAYFTTNKGSVYIFRNGWLYGALLK